MGLRNAAFGIGLLVLACANPPQTRVVWEKTGPGDATLEAARVECTAASESVDDPGVRRDRYSAESMGRAFVDCMRARGWTWRTEEIPD